MPAKKRPKPIYQRGDFKLYEREDRPNLEILWYDPTIGRERSSSARTGDHAAAKLELDRRYKALTSQVCEKCGRPFDGETSPLLTRAVTDYLLDSEGKAGYAATRSRLGHVIAYVAETNPLVTCAAVDGKWADGFRKWLADRPIVEPVSGKTRKRSIGHVEGCVRQLIAAINATHGQEASFKALQAKAVSQSPTYRASAEKLAAMFDFCLNPPARSDKERATRVREREALLAYLRIAVATWARPEEIFDLGAGQWLPDSRVLDLNPPERRQTRKYRTRIAVPRQLAPYLDEMGERYMTATTVRAPWAKMRKAIGLPSKRGEAGEKLIRRSMATLVRKRIGEAQFRQVEMMLGHVKHGISDIYALPDPANLGLALAATEEIIDEICAIVPGAYRKVTATGRVLSVVDGGKNG